MDTLEEQLRCLVKEACKHQYGSASRQKNLTQLMRLIQNKLLKENTPYYGDALQQTWVYFCENICQRKTGELYDPTDDSIVTWLNTYLQQRLEDFYIDAPQKQDTRTVAGQFQSSGLGETEKITDPVNNLEATPDVPSLLEDIRKWAQTDPDGELRCIHIAGFPSVTAQVLILRRLPLETSWKILAAEFGLPVSTLSRFYQQQCLPLLRKFNPSSVTLGKFDEFTTIRPTEDQGFTPV